MAQPEGDAPTPAEGLTQLRAMNGAPVATLSEQERVLTVAVARWFGERCIERGVDPPPDLFRAMLYCAAQVYTFNLAVDQADQTEADASAPRH